MHGHEWTCAGKGAAQRAFVPGASAAHGHLGRVVASHAMLCCTVFASLGRASRLLVQESEFRVKKGSVYILFT